jgi:hypothetical protein
VAPAGIIAITVPPAKHQIVGGHVTIWNAGLLLYNLIIAGNDCRLAAVKSEGYDISVIAPKVPIRLPNLRRDVGDIETLQGYFPLAAKQGFDGRISELNWD